jgi:hypothetical protein
MSDRHKSKKKAIIIKEVKEQLIRVMKIMTK